MDFQSHYEYFKTQYSNLINLGCPTFQCRQTLIENVRVSVMYFDNKESSAFFSMIIQYVIDKVLFVNFVFMIEEIN